MRLSARLQLQVILLLGTTTLFGANLPFKSNVDATVTVTPSVGSAQEFSVTGGEEKTLNITWTNEGWQDTEDDCTFKIVPTSDRYADSTFTHTVSTNWNAALNITLSEAPLPEDSAYLPIRVNVPATLKATAISMIEGSAPSQVFTFDLAGKVSDTIVLPVKSEGTPILTGKNKSLTQISFSKSGNTHLASLPSLYKNGKIAIVSMNGRRLSTFNLTSEVQNDISVWNVASGIYMIQLTSPNGEVSAHKMHHAGGDLRIAASFGSSFELGGIMNSRTVRTAGPRAATAQYSFEIIPNDSKYQDTTLTVDLTGQMNSAKSFYFLSEGDTGNAIIQLMDEFTYEEFFPNRYGLGYGAYTTSELPDDPSQISKLPSDGDYDFYTYESFLNATNNLSDIVVDLYVALDGNGKVQNGCSRLIWQNKKTGVSKEFKTQANYDEALQWGEEQFVGTIDYASFCNEGDMATRKQELAAFLGNISHETTAADARIVKDRIWGLYWREEVAWQNGSTALGYVDQYKNDLYPPTSGQSYHGRGPIQITHNINYGQLSEFLYGNKQLLLDNPGLLVPNKPEDATVAFMSAIWFWMTPQAPKPSCHDVMVGNWIPTAEDIAANRDKSKFGMTINIINGGLECEGKSDYRVDDRIEYYERYIKLLGEVPEEDCTCNNMEYYK